MNKFSPYTTNEKNEVKFLPHKGQKRALKSRARFVLVLAGTQGGKTVMGPWWLLREMIIKGPGDYMVVGPNYPLMKKKVLPELLILFQSKLKIVEYRAADKIFHINKYGEKFLFGEEQDSSTQIFIGHAEDSESLESATAKAAWLDEPGQKRFKFASWEAILRRLSIHEGRALLTTTPYTLGWLKNELHDKEDGKEIKVINFDSISNPAFPKKEYEKRLASMPRWKFNMMYKGLFTRPEGMIYDCFEEHHKVKRFQIPSHWSIYAGMDFGGVNTAAVFLAHDPEADIYYLYRSYKAGGRTAKEHGEYIWEPQLKHVIGGTKSEQQWRDEFIHANLFVHEPPISDVEVGINRVYSMLKKNKLFIFDDIAGVIDELEQYARVLDDNDQPTEKIEDKNSYHYCDALRYIACDLMSDTEDIHIS